MMNMYLWFDVESATQVTVNSQAHRRRMVSESRARQLEEIVWMLMSLHSRLVQHARMGHKRRSVSS